MSETSRKVEVTFIDDATGSPFARTEMDPTNLPETFAVETTLHLGDTDWSVVDAQPATRSDCAKAGTLTLRLRRVETVDPKDILFSLPSICDGIPGVGDGPLAGDELLLAEDDWRQVELVSRQFGSEADAEIAAIRRIHDHAWAEVGWREIHVRRRPDPPITAPLTVADLARAFGAGAAFRGVSYYGAESPIRSGFSFRAADGLQGYGTEAGGRVTVLGLAPAGEGAAPVRSADALAEVARAFDLDLVHWCRCVRVPWDAPAFRQLVLGADA